MRSLYISVTSPRQHWCYIEAFAQVSSEKDPLNLSSVSNCAQIFRDPKFCNQIWAQNLSSNNLSCSPHSCVYLSFLGETSKTKFTLENQLSLELWKSNFWAITFSTEIASLNKPLSKWDLLNISIIYLKQHWYQIEAFAGASSEKRPQ